jgi:hypothetical protein
MVGMLYLSSDEYKIMRHQGESYIIEVSVVDDTIFGEIFPIHTVDVFIYDENDTLWERICTNYDGFGRTEGAYDVGMRLVFKNYLDTIMAKVVVLPNDYSEYTGDTVMQVTCQWMGVGTIW